ncbi:MAG: TRAP transporter small permease subunit [Alphaproteobacteria bacterium]|nr:TRAP transporter small permease subunit [Alphaproteobacteria bacterium]
MAALAPGEGRGTLDRVLRSYLAVSKRVVLAVSMAFLALMVAVNSLEIVGRGLFNHSFVWVQEISILAAMWVYFFAYGLVAKDEEYIRVDILAKTAGPTVRAAFALFARVATIGFHSVVVWFGIETMRFLGLFRTSVLDWPESLFVLPILLGAIDILVTECIYLRWSLSGRSSPAGRESA